MNKAENSALEKVLMAWESEEHSVEEKLDHLRKYIFESLGLEHEPEYYVKKGKFFERYVAGFVGRYFQLLKDVSFIILDPLHIIDIMTSFAKGVFLHPIKTLKQVWKIWTGAYTKGVYGLGRLTADALLACVIAAAGTLLAGGKIALAAEEAAGAAVETVVGTVSSLPKRIANIGKGIKNALTSSGDFFDMIKEAPLEVLSDAKKSLISKSSYGKIKLYKYYAKPFMKKQAA